MGLGGAVTKSPLEETGNSNVQRLFIGWVVTQGSRVENVFLLEMQGRVSSCLGQPIMSGRVLELPLQALLIPILVEVSFIDFQIK